MRVTIKSSTAIVGGSLPGGAPTHVNSSDLVTETMYHIG